MGELKHYIHDNGRRCQWVERDGSWQHWDHEQPEPGPDERRDYVCRMDHLWDRIKSGPLPDMEPDERGEFGMPGLGGPFGRLALGINGPMNPIDHARTVDSFKMPHPDGNINIPGHLVKTALAERILERHVVDAIEHFLRRNAEYGDDDDFNLGARGQYVDISRKVQKLKRRMWDGQEAREGEESTMTILMELIGHLLMTMDYLVGEDGNGPQDGAG